MNVRQIISFWLKENGYDGLYTTNCSCTLENLMMCDERDNLLECKAGYKMACRCSFKCDYHIGTKKDIL